MSPTSSRRLRVGAFWCFLASVFLLGGDAREDHVGLILLYPASVLLAGAAWAATPRAEHDWRPMRVPVMLLGILAAIAAVQLVPLPEVVWSTLPGRLAWVEPATIAGIAPGWLPLSIVPDLTLGALAALVVPAAAMVLAIMAPNRQELTLGWALLGGILAAAILGVAQYAAGANVGLHLQAMVYPGEMTGVFANRNHHALFLAIAVPVAATVFATSPRLAARGPLALTVLALIVIVVTAFVAIAGSRSAFVLLAIGLVLSWILLAPALPGWTTVRNVPPAARIAAPFAGLALLVVAGAAADGRLVALDRLVDGNFADDLRWRIMPVLFRMIGDHWLLGTGFGSFDTLYRIYEPLRLLQEGYVNHAHNDVLELWLEGGLPALAVFAAFVSWVGACGFRAIRRDPVGQRTLFARAGLIIVVLLGGASLADYPVRTPLFQVVLVIACVWLAGARTNARRPLPSSASSLEDRSPSNGLGSRSSTRQARVGDAGN